MDKTKKTDNEKRLLAVRVSNKFFERISRERDRFDKNVSLQYFISKKLKELFNYKGE